MTFAPTELRYVTLLIITCIYNVEIRCHNDAMNHAAGERRYEKSTKHFFREIQHLLIATCGTLRRSLG